MNTRVTRCALVLVCAGALALAGSAQAQNLVLNPGFEALDSNSHPTLTPWTQYDPLGVATFSPYPFDENNNPCSGIGDVAGAGYDDYWAHTGLAGYAFGAFAPMTQGTGLKQDIATTTGQQYQVTFYLQHSNVSSSVDAWFKASFGGHQLIDMEGKNYDPNIATETHWVKGTFGPNEDGSGLDANGVYWTGARNDALTIPRPMEALTFFVTATDTTSTLDFTAYNNDNDFVHLDDVSVVATPEPATLALLGLGGLTLLRRKRK